MTIQPTEYINGNDRREYKQCAGRGCNNPGINCLKIRLIHKTGYFCESCKTFLTEQNLVEMGH